MSNEKEQKTYDSLMVTPVTGAKLVWTKLTASVAVFVILLMVALPFAAASFILGGVAPKTLLLVWVYGFLLTLLMGALGLYWSTVFDRSIASIPAATVCAIALISLPAIFASEGPQMIASFSPLHMTGHLMQIPMVPFYGINLPFWPIAFALMLLAFSAFAASAIQRLEFKEERNYRPFRVLIGLFWLIWLCAWIGELNGHAVPTIEAGRARFTQTFILVHVTLLLLAPWVGANLPVARSERRRAERFKVKRKWLGFLLTQPMPFMGGLALLVVPFLWLARSFVPAFSGRNAALAVFSISLVVAVAAWTRISRRLADGQTAKRRYIGLAVAYGLLLVVCIIPMFLLHWAEMRIGGQPSAYYQILASLSPFTGIAQLSDVHMWTAHMPLSFAGLGARGIGLIALAFHALLLAWTFLPSFSRKDAKGA